MSLPSKVTIFPCMKALGLLVVVFVLILFSCRDTAWNGLGKVTYWQMRSLVFAAMFVVFFFIAIFYGIYIRFVRKDVLLFGETGIVDNLSEARLGEIPWADVEDIDLKITWWCSSLTIYFVAHASREERPLPRHLMIKTLGMSKRDGVRINELLSSHRPVEK